MTRQPGLASIDICPAWVVGIEFCLNIVAAEVQRTLLAEFVVPEVALPTAGQRRITLLAHRSPVAFGEHYVHEVGIELAMFSP